MAHGQDPDGRAVLVMAVNASPEMLASSSLETVSLLSSSSSEGPQFKHDQGEHSSDCRSILDHSSDDDLNLNFSPRKPFNLWRKLSCCEEFVGTKRSKHTIVAWNDRIYVFGGDDGRRMLNDFLVSHIRDSSWARVVYTGVCVCAGTYVCVYVCILSEKM